VRSRSQAIWVDFDDPFFWGAKIISRTSCPSVTKFDSVRSLASRHLLWSLYEIGRPLYFCHVVSFFFLLSSFFLLLFSSPNLRGRRLDIYHTSTHANLECRSETCCMQLSGNAGPKKSPKITSGHHRTTLSGYIYAIEAHIDNRKNC